MDIKTNNTLDMAINKDDLIDIMIDNQLTELETKLEALRLKEKELTDKIEKNAKECKEAFSEKLLTFLPKDLKTKEIPTLQFYQGSGDTSVTFYFKDYQIRVEHVDTRDTSALKKKNDAEDEKMYGKVTDLRADMKSINEEIITITKSPKRLKAKMLKTFLGASTEGKQVLSLINNSLTTKQLLAPDTTSKKSK